MATATYYPNNGICPPQQHADLVCVAFKYTKSHDEAVAETKRLLGADVEPRHPSNNATEIYILSHPTQSPTFLAFEFSCKELACLMVAEAISQGDLWKNMVSQSQIMWGLMKS